MSTISLHYLEERLQTEAPGLHWCCEPVSARHLAGTMLPEEIQVRATHDGEPVSGSPFYLSGECLIRWGLDRSASLICNELTASTHPKRGLGVDWDRLAEF